MTSRFCSAIGVGAVLTIASFAVTERAAAVTLPIYSAIANASGGGVPIVYGDSTVTNITSSLYPDGRTAFGQSVNGPQGIGFAGSGGVPVRDPDDDFDGVLSPEVMSGGGGGRFRFDDVIFTSDDPEAISTSVSVDFLLEGVIGLTRQTGANSAVRGTIGVTLGLGVPGPGSGAVEVSIGTLSRESMGNAAGVDEFVARNNGIFGKLGDDSSLSIDAVFSTPERDVPLGVPVIFSMSTGGTATAVARDETGVSATIDFMNTFSLAPNGKVFNLPQGVTASSVRGGVVNNAFVPLASVPLPAPVALLAGGLVLIAAVGRRR